MEGERRLADRIPARLSPREGRKFGLTVGIAFLVLGGISHWRGHQIAPLVLWTMGGLLAAGGLLLPGQLGGVYRAWMGLSHLLSKVTTPLFMGLVYFLVITPMGLLMRIFGRNPMVHRPGEAGYWHVRKPDPDQANSLTRQF
jgi:hypothetical protein